MWIDPLMVDALDNPAGRQELARAAATAARAATPDVDIEILWDGMWMRRVGPHYFADPEMFHVAEPNWERWSYAAEKCLRDADDYWFHVYKPRAGDVIVDIGAGRGEDVFAFSRAVGPHGKVYAVEPHPISFAALKKSCERNRLSNVTTIDCACVGAPAKLEIETLPVWESNYVRSGPASPTSFAVKGERFDDLCLEHAIERIDFLKMNIEGAERIALPAAGAHSIALATSASRRTTSESPAATASSSEPSPLSASF